jgi:hypothetical protein
MEDIEKRILINSVDNISLEQLSNNITDMHGNLIHKTFNRDNRIKLECNCDSDDQFRLDKYIGKEVWMLIEDNETKLNTSNYELPPLKGFISEIKYEPYYQAAVDDKSYYKVIIEFIGGFSYIKEQGEIFKVNEKTVKGNPTKRKIKRKTNRDLKKQEKNKDFMKRKISFI